MNFQVKTDEAEQHAFRRVTNGKSLVANKYAPENKQTGRLRPFFDGPKWHMLVCTISL